MRTLLIVAILFASAPARAGVRQIEGRPVYFSGDKPFFVYSATFAYSEYPKDLWPAQMVRLKRMGFNTLQVPVAAGKPSDLAEVLRLAKQLGFRVWLGNGAASGHTSGESSETASSVARISGEGAAILDGIAPSFPKWFPAPEGAALPKRSLFPADFSGLSKL